MYVCMYVCMHACMYLCMYYTCMYVSMYVFMHLYEFVSSIKSFNFSVRDVRHLREFGRKINSCFYAVCLLGPAGRQEVLRSDYYLGQ